MMRKIENITFKVSKFNAQLVEFYEALNFICNWRRAVPPLSHKTTWCEDIFFPEIKVILAIVFTFYFVCWSQLPLNMLVSFRRCTKIRCCFCDRKFLIQKIRCLFKWNYKDSISGQMKNIIICLKDVKLQYYEK